MEFKLGPQRVEINPPREIESLGSLGDTVSKVYSLWQRHSQKRVYAPRRVPVCFSFV